MSGWLCSSLSGECTQDNPILLRRCLGVLLGGKAMITFRTSLQSETGWNSNRSLSVCGTSIIEKKRQTNKTNEESNGNNINKKFRKESNLADYWYARETPNKCAKNFVLLNKQRPSYPKNFRENSARRSLFLIVTLSETRSQNKLCDNFEHCLYSM